MGFSGGERSFVSGWPDMEVLDVGGRDNGMDMVGIVSLKLEMGDKKCHSGVLRFSLFYRLRAAVLASKIEAGWTGEAHRTMHTSTHKVTY